MVDLNLITFDLSLFHSSSHLVLFIILRTMSICVSIIKYLSSVNNFLLSSLSSRYIHLNHGTNFWFFSPSPVSFSSSKFPSSSSFSSFKFPSSSSFSSSSSPAVLHFPLSSSPADLHFPLHVLQQLFIFLFQVPQRLFIFLFKSSSSSSCSSFKFPSSSSFSIAICQTNIIIQLISQLFPRIQEFAQ